MDSRLTLRTGFMSPIVGNQRVQVFDDGGQHLANWSGFGIPFGLIVIGDELLASEGTNTTLST